ncbi:UNVERIFIED_CONTAM: hypothetical protein Scaly_0866700 [Sesamum calycinum]|uniref:Retrovirus-related Pol polyprotein from transposon TNT 1-94-like beta-barrel domain-containing protein n=1 Tax=Sesamum calycinum TaxID=2727403 RepID=A0AAW2QVL1_9LAMI
MPNVQLAETNVEEIIAMVSNLQICTVTELNMAAAVKSFDWWYDSGATVHVCNDKNQFKHYEATAGGQQVLMGNANTTTVLGKENVGVQFTSGKKLLLTNVLHVPEIRKNLVSAAILSKKGLKTMIEADKLIVIKNGKFVGKRYYCDGMFKLCTIMNVMNKINNSAYVFEFSLSSLWLKRLDYLGLQVILVLNIGKALEESLDISKELRIWDSSIISVFRPGPDRPVRPVRPGTGHVSGSVHALKPGVVKPGEDRSNPVKTGKNR